MKNTPIRLIILLGSLTLAGVIFTQVFWVSKAISNNKEQFNHNVQMALRNVVESLCEINGNDMSNDPIDQVSANYFIARTNYSIDLSSLEYLIKAELEKRSLKEDFEFGVYDCQTQRMVYGDFVSFGKEKVEPMGKLPKLDHDEYYFGVYFPNRNRGLVNDLGFWKFTSVLTVLIALTFGYAMFVILRQKRLSEIQRDFINNMTHEFKTPLSTLILSAEVLKGEVTTDRASKYADIIKSESERLQEHITRFLDTSSLEHSIRRVTEKIEVNKILLRVGERFSNLEKEIDWHLIDEELIILGDPETFNKIIFNLMDNAFKYGERLVRVKTEKINNVIAISISNDGKTIPNEFQNKIFDQFYRIPSGDIHDVKGFGLGLYFVKKAMKQFGGKVRVSSNEKETIFSLLIPTR